jgi:predicted TIM-barrel fold metal-dependent hydrolase
MLLPKFWNFLLAKVSAVPLHLTFGGIDQDLLSDTTRTKKMPQQTRTDAHLRLNLKTCCISGIALCLYCLSMALAGNAQEAAGRTHTLSVKQGDLSQHRSLVLSGLPLEEFASLEPIDTHTHIFQNAPAFIAMLERLHMHVLDILVVDDTESFGKSIEPQKQDALKVVASSMGHASLCTSFDPFQFNNPDFPQRAIASLNQDFSRGAIAVKIWKNVGMELKDSYGRYVMPDDPRLEPIYKDIAAHHKTLIAHLAEPDEAWESANPGGLSASYYAAHPQWNMSKNPGAPSKQRILQARDHLLQMNPDLRVVGAHLGSMEDDVNQLAASLQKYPNFAVDTAARVPHLMIQPRSKVRAFILKYQDQIIYGTDLGFLPGKSVDQVVKAWNEHYALDWRYLATDDIFEYHGSRIEGLNLPRSVLRKLYHDNAVRWIPGV